MRVSATNFQTSCKAMDRDVKELAPIFRRVNSHRQKSDNSFLKVGLSAYEDSIPHSFIFSPLRNTVARRLSHAHSYAHYVRFGTTGLHGGRGIYSLGDSTFIFEKKLSFRAEIVSNKNRTIKINFRLQ